jgi:hypothetical protein
VLSDLHSVAPQVNGVIKQLGPFSKAAIPAFDSLGEASKTGIPAVTDARPVIGDLRSLANAVRPVGATAANLLESFQKTQGIERLMDYIFYQVSAINGFDALGHYLRAELIVNQCANYAVRPVAGCSSNYPQATASSSSSSDQAVASVASAVGDDPTLRATAIALAKALGQQVEKAKKQHAAKTKKPKAGKHGAAKKRTAKHKTPGAKATPTPAPGGGVTGSPAGPLPTPAPEAPAAAAPTETATASPTPTPTQQGTGDALLDYLFGGGGG